MKITVLFTCFNRKEKSIKCIKSLIEGNRGYDLNFIIVDDNSTDGTREAITALEAHTKIIIGTGDLFWSGGMRVGIKDFLNTDIDSEYLLLVNDDVEFYSGIIEKLVLRSMDNNDAIVVGATCNFKGELSYGAKKLIVPRKKGMYSAVEPSDEQIDCDTFNCNCVLIKKDIIKKVGNFDDKYRHSLADLDYGFKLKTAGYTILSSVDYIGICNNNSIKGTWRDSTLSRIERVRKKESVKGSPFREWFYFLNKNFGLQTAIKYSISPYVRILLGK